MSLLGYLPAKTSFFCVSLDDEDTESGKQESDEPDTTDSEVCLLSWVHYLGLLGSRGVRQVVPA